MILDASPHRSPFLHLLWRAAGVAIVAANLMTMATAAEATIFTRIDDQELMDQAGWIVEAQVIAIERSLDVSIPAVEYKVQVTQWLKGTPRGDEITVRLAGGVRADGVALHLLGRPSLRLGDRLLLFLSPEAQGFFRPTQFFLGVFRAVRTSDGRLLALRETGDALELRLPESPAQEEGQREFELFRSWLQDRAAGLSRVPDYFLTSLTAKDIPAARYTTITSSTEPEPVGCGANGGHKVRWFDFDGGGVLPWRGYLLGQPGLEELGLPHLAAALEAWNEDPGTPIDLEFAGITAKRTGLSGPDGTNALLFDDPNDEIDGAWAGQGILALGGPWFSCQPLPLDNDLFHPIIEGDIVTQDGLEEFFASLADPQRAGEELFSHEIGHTLGLGHSTDPEALMFAEIHADGRGAHLTFDDRAALGSLYGPPPGLLPPAPPNALTARSLSPRTIELSWQDDSADEEGFRIERRTEGPFHFVATVPDNQPLHVDSSALPTTNYTYRVRAQNRAGASPWSNEVTVTTAPEGVPEAPSNLRAAPLSGDRIRLTWQDNEGLQAGFGLDYQYFIFAYAPSTSHWVRIPVPLSSATHAADLVGLPPSAEPLLQVRARNSLGDSAPSNSVVARTFPAEASCTTTEQALCLLRGRFRVEASFRNQYAENAPTSSARALPSTDQIGQFWFFDPDNLELVVKLIDGRTANGHFWVYYGGITDLEVWLTITDTETDVQRIYHKEPGEFCGEADITAFPAHPDGQNLEVRVPDTPQPVIDLGTSFPRDGDTGTCQVTETTLCLLRRRLQVTLNWSLPGRQESLAGQAINDGGDSGSFWFFDPQNTEVVVKAIDGRELNDHLWIFFGALSNLEYELVVTDTLTEESRIYYNSPGGFCGQADTQAFRVLDPS